MRVDLLGELFSDVDVFLGLEPSSIERADELGRRIKKNAEELEEAIQDEEVRKKFKDNLAGLDKQSSKLARSVLNSRKGSLRLDWRRFARRDFDRLKDEVLALREFLILHRETIRKFLNRLEYGADLAELVEAIYGEGALHQTTYVGLTNSLVEASEEDIQEVMDKSSERISRISRWASILHEVRRTEENVGQRE